MNKEKIKALALANGFKLKEQADGSMDLNPYVYQFAAALERLATAELKAQVKQLRGLLLKHGICVDCGSIFNHDIEEPFAHCGCHTSEWYDFTPYMELQYRLHVLSQQLRQQAKAGEQ
jgi:hypothetical protein